MKKEANNYTVRDLLSEPLGEDDKKNIKEIIDRGELIVYPTETLYGLGADPFSQTAIERLVKAKGRPINMPLSLAVASLEMMRTVSHVGEDAEAIYRAFLPGPVTILLPKKDNVFDSLTGGSGSVGIRVPDHPAVLDLIESLGPLTATSANIHNRDAPWMLDTAVSQLGDAVALYLDGGVSKYQGPSTVVDISGTSAKIIRRGVISEDEILAVLGRE